MLSVEAQRKQELQRKLQKLVGKTDLSAKQQKKLARLQAIEANPSESPQAIASTEGQQQTLADTREGVGVAGTKRASEQAGPAAPAAKRVYKVEPCRDEGHWGDDGEWVYPADREIECSTCQTQFTFSGEDQAWYAKRELYAPARCTTCRNAKKEAKEIKQKSGKSGEGRCFNCGATGHGTATCPKSRSDQKMCYVCGSSAHLSRNCPSAVSKKSTSGCFTCGSTAHLSRECPKRPPPVCFSAHRRRPSATDAPWPTHSRTHAALEVSSPARRHRSCFLSARRLLTWRVPLDMSADCGNTGHSQKACDKPLRTEGVCFAFANKQCFNKKCKFAH